MKVTSHIAKILWSSSFNNQADSKRTSNKFSQKPDIIKLFIDLQTQML